MNENWVQIIFILVLGAVAIVALVIAVALADNSQDKGGAIAVATACVAVFGTVVTRILDRHKNGDT